MQENIPIEEVFENLRCSKDGLTTEAAEQRLTIFGYNKLEEKKVKPFSLFLSLVLCSFFLKILCSGCVSGEQILEVFGVYVEPSLMGYGSCCYYGNCSCKWRSKYSKHPVCSFFFSWCLKYSNLVPLCLS